MQEVSLMAAATERRSIVTILALAPSALDAQTVVRELNHRINNDFASAINIVSVGVMLAEDSEVKAALSRVVELLDQYVEVHRALAMPESGVLTDAAEYLRRLGVAIRRSRLDRINIRLIIAAKPLLLEGDRCWRLGLVVHELVTNSARHACFDNRDVGIRIELGRAGSMVNCRISDNGAPAKLKPGCGLRIVAQLVRSLGGRLKSELDANSTSLVIRFPLTEREYRPNHIVSRNARTRRHLKATRSLGSAARLPGSNSRALQLYGH